jgi:hypothetical protein
MAHVMTTRRRLLQTSLAAGGLTFVKGGEGNAGPPAGGVSAEDPSVTRAYWRQTASKIASPVLHALARHQLKASMPVEQATSRDRRSCTHLEAFGRLVAGLAPWVELGGDETPEGLERSRIGDLTRASLDAATDRRLPDFLNFTEGRQPLVDAAFLAQGLMRAPNELWEKLPLRVKQATIDALKSTRAIKPHNNNWLLFATTVEIFLHKIGDKYDASRLFDGIEKHRDWYKGDGVYGDGPEFHWDYYNSFVIQPMLLDAVDTVAAFDTGWDDFRVAVRQRFTRWAAIQERSVAPDGSFPAIGRSLSYRCGALHGLSLAALKHLLPPEVPAGQARLALTRCIRKTMEPSGTFNAGGWLQIGLCGHQPSLGESYISTGSLYLCSVALLPLGLRPDSPFWSEPATSTTWERAWSGAPVAADSALKSPA